MAAVTTRVPGHVLTDHLVDVPLDHADPDGATIEVFAREVVAAGRERDDLPWLLFLQGGPGGASPRPGGGPGDGWLAHATRTHRVLLLDQRGTGRSTPFDRRVVGSAGLGTDAELATHVRRMRADSIVRDAEVLRERVADGRRWETLGQSYGGWVTMTYLSLAPEGLDACYVTGGLPGLTARADDVYARTYPRVAAKNAEHHTRFPGDAALLRRVADHLETEDVRLPDGDRLTVRRLRMLGQLLGMGDGSLRLHWLLERAWHPAAGGLTDAFLHAVAAETAHAEGPLFLLQEYLYGQPGSGPTAWAAERAMAEHPGFAADRDPLLLTGEMAYRWMFTDIAALRPFLGAADLLAAYDDWEPLYDLDRLAANEVPVLAAVYHDDMYVDAGLSLDTAARVGSVRTWVTNEFEHDGLRVAAPAVLGRLMDMRAGRV